MKVEWQEIDGEHYFNDPARGWLKKVLLNTIVPANAVYACGTENDIFWNETSYAGSEYTLHDLSTWGIVYGVPCDPPCTMTPQTSLDVCLEYVVYRVNKVAKKLQPEAREAFLQKVYALKQQFAFGVDKLMQEVQK